MTFNANRSTALSVREPSDQQKPSLDPADARAARRAAALRANLRRRKAAGQAAGAAPRGAEAGADAPPGPSAHLTRP